MIDYAPARWLVESKSLKLYLTSFRNHGAFHEDCTLAIAGRLVEFLSPRWLRIAGYWYPRGGMPIDVFWQTGRPPAGLVDPGSRRRALSRPRLSAARRHLDGSRMSRAIRDATSQSMVRRRRWRSMLPAPRSPTCTPPRTRPPWPRSRSNGRCAEPSAAKLAAVEFDRPPRRGISNELSDRIWAYAEIALREHRSAAALADYAEQQGFRVQRGVAGMPTAFVATYGKGRPVIGVMGEYDALPGLSQKALRGEGAARRGCGRPRLRPQPVRRGEPRCRDRDQGADRSRAG